MTCARAAPPRCTSRGLRAYQRVTVHIQGVRAQTTDHARHTCAQNADHLAHKSSFSAFFVEVVCTVGATSPHAAAPPPPLGGNCIIRTSTRRRHAVNQLLVLQNPHHVPSHDIPNAEQAPAWNTMKPPSPLRPKSAPKMPISHPQRRQGFRITGPPGRQGQAAAHANGDDTASSQISHVIYRGHFLRCPKNVAIPTIQIRSLNKSSRNYVRN